MSDDFFDKVGNDETRKNNIKKVEKKIEDDFFDKVEIKNTSSKNTTNNFYTKFTKVMMIIAYIGSIFLSIEEECQHVSSYGICDYSDPAFNFETFIILIVSITISGVFLYGFSTIIENVKETKDTTKLIYKEMKKKK